MCRQRLRAVAWQTSKALSALAIGSWMGRHVMGGGGVQGWISRGACALMFLGGLANVVVVILNRGFMPVRVDQVHGRERFSYEPIHSGTRLWFLGDCIRLGTSYASPGDLLLYGGFALMMIGVVLPTLII